MHKLELRMLAVPLDMTDRDRCEVKRSEVRLYEVKRVLPTKYNTTQHDILRKPFMCSCVEISKVRRYGEGSRGVYKSSLYVYL
jgi:hypothetical protein